MAGVCAAALLVLPVTACGLIDQGPSEEEQVQAFLDGVVNGNIADAANRTTEPRAAGATIESTRRDLSAQAARANVREVTTNERDEPVAKFDMVWNFGADRRWSYVGTAPLVEDDQQEWKIRWSPSVLHPRLSEGQSLAFHEDRPDPAPVYDRTGTELMSPQSLVTVTFNADETDDAAAVAEELADALEPIEPSITQQSIMDGARDAPEGQPYTVVTLRPADYERVRGDVHTLPGVHFPERTQLTAVNRELGSQVLAGVTQRMNQRVAANTGWRVDTQESASGAPTETLHEVAPRPVSPLRTSLGEGTQRAAEQALQDRERPAMLVAMRPSNGEMLAVGQNDAADRQGPVAWTGQYPPGSTFKMVTATAALESGDLDVDSPVRCPGTATFDGRVLPNEDEFDLGTVPLHTAFARSCNTSFAGLATDQPSDALPAAARQLGLGVDFEMPGATTITGTVEPADSAVGRAENGIGQGTVLASPFGMALVTASVANGTMPTPTLLPGTETTVTNPAPNSPAPEAVDQVRNMMREVTTDGTAAELDAPGPVHGKTGTAQFGDGSQAHGWFTGFRGDLAFAVLVTEAGSADPAVATAESFLTEAD